MAYTHVRSIFEFNSFLFHEYEHFTSKKVWAHGDQYGMAHCMELEFQMVWNGHVVAEN